MFLLYSMQNWWTKMALGSITFKEYASKKHRNPISGGGGGGGGLLHCQLYLAAISA